MKKLTIIIISIILIILFLPLIIILSKQGIDKHQILNYAGEIETKFPELNCQNTKTHTKESRGMFPHPEMVSCTTLIKLTQENQKLLVNRTKYLLLEDNWQIIEDRWNRVTGSKGEYSLTIFLSQGAGVCDYEGERTCPVFTSIERTR